MIAIIGLAFNTFNAWFNMPVPSLAFFAAGEMLDKLSPNFPIPAEPLPALLALSETPCISFFKSPTVFALLPVSTFISAAITVFSAISILYLLLVIILL